MTEIEKQELVVKELAQAMFRSHKKEKITYCPTTDTKIDYLEAKNKLLEMKLDEAEKEIAVSDILLKERKQLLSIIPKCNIHGECVPHAIEWIKEMKVIEQDNAFYKNKLEAANKELVMRSILWDREDQKEREKSIGKELTLQDYCDIYFKDINDKHLKIKVLGVSFEEACGILKYICEDINILFPKRDTYNSIFFIVKSKEKYYFARESNNINNPFFVYNEEAENKVIQICGTEFLDKIFVY